MSYIEEFAPDEHPPVEVIAWLEANGFIDQSWHNDAFPCWTKGNVCIWASSEEVAAVNEATQFTITRMTDAGEHDQKTDGRDFKNWESCYLEAEHILEHGWLDV